MFRRGCRGWRADLKDGGVSALQRSDLDQFLFADIGVEGSGMPLSVVSALARVGLDPWQEAVRLARLPRAVAVDGLARLIATMPASLWTEPDARPIAARLVALLPQAGTAPGLPLVKQMTLRVRVNASWVIIGVLMFAILASMAAQAWMEPADTGPVPIALVPAVTAPALSVPALSVPALSVSPGQRHAGD